MITLFLFILGLVVGSFLNVLGLRWNSGLSIGGRSFCVVCKKKLHWWELVPVVSFMGLRGRCSECKTKISWQYPLVELWTGLVFITIPLLAIPIFCIYVVITIYDLRHKIIPDALSYSAVVLAIIYRLSLGGSSLIDWFAGPILFLFFASIWFLSRGRAMGLGDGKLALSGGLLLGFSQGLSAITLAFWIGAAVSLLIMLIFRLFNEKERLTMKSEIPFAPFIILGVWISLIFHLDLFHVFAFF
ncbi:MAG: prepilin peptidase [Minisyncoccota bacterium]